MTTTYHWWVLLCVLKMSFGKYVDRHPRGAECELCYDRGVQVKQKIIGARLPASSMRKIPTEADPLIDFEQQIRQVDVGYAPADLCFQSLHTVGEVITVILRHDHFAMLDSDTIASVQLTVHML
jgi:hypothetical protein